VSSVSLRKYRHQERRNLWIPEIVVTFTCDKIVKRKYVGSIQKKVTMYFSLPHTSSLYKIKYVKIYTKLEWVFECI